MLNYALKMLINNKTKYLGLVVGLSFAAFIITQQAAIFIGLMTRSYGFITDTAQGDLWIMDEHINFEAESVPMRDTEVLRVKSIEGIKWAVPLYKGLIRARLPTGFFRLCVVIGIDDATLIGGPPKMIEGSVRNLRYPDGIILSKDGAEKRLGTPQNPVQVGDVFELNDHRAKVVGICDLTKTFQSQSVIYTTYSRATTFAPRERQLLTFVLAKVEEGYSIQDVAEHIRRVTKKAVYTNEEFKQLTFNYYMENTGIPLNFGIAVLLGFLIGTAIAGQTLYSFTCDNLPYLATFKAMGANHAQLVKMALGQALFVGGIGWGIGMGFAALFGFFSRGTELSFLMPWQLFLGSGVALLFITLFAASLSVLKILKIDPVVVFQR